MSDFWASLLDPDIRGRMDILLLIVFSLAGAIWLIFTYIRPRKNPETTGKPTAGSGGHASVQGSGTALGGRGGRAGNLGSGGHGGNASVEGSGTAIGGDGGDGAVSWRPALGAPSAAERAANDGLSQFLPRDQFGFIVAGSGGVGGDANATVDVDGRKLPIVPMLKLLRLWEPRLLEELDAMFPRDPQDGWDHARQRFPTQTLEIERHVINCLEGKGPAPDPYEKVRM
jgi:hypothetical protein